MQSKLEREVEIRIKWGKLPAPVKEFMFHPTRRWRFDYAYPDKKIAIECEGGIFVAGRHTRGMGFAKDCVKYNSATVLGWRVLRYTTKNIQDLTNDLKGLL